MMECNINKIKNAPIFYNLALHCSRRSPRQDNLVYTQSQSIDNTADKGGKIHNLLFSKTNLTGWQQNGPVHQGDYHLLQPNLLLGSGTCQQVFQNCQRFTNAGSNSREEFLFCYRLPVKLLQLCLPFAALLKAPQFCFSSLHS